MARRRRRNPSQEEIITIGLAAVGGAAVMYLYMNSIQQAAASKTVALTVPSTTSG